MPLDLLLEAIVAGVLLGAFYAAVSVGLSLAFGLLEVHLDGDYNVVGQQADEDGPNDKDGPNDD